MKAKQLLLLLHPLVLTSLLLLLLNDFVLKQNISNAFTGKISDLSGLFVFTVFLSCLFPSKKLHAAIFTIAFFSWFKSPASEPMLIFLQTRLHLPVHRVVDYTDLFALVMVPLALRLQPAQWKPTVIRTATVWLVSIACLFSFTATSMVRRLTDERRIELNSYLRTRSSEKEIISAIEEKGMHPQPDSAIYERVWSNQYYLKEYDSSHEIMIPVEQVSRGLYTRLKYGSIYRIPQVYLHHDTIYNLQLLIDDITPKRNSILLHSFESHRILPDTGNYYLSGWSERKKYRRAIKKLFKKIVN